MKRLNLIYPVLFGAFPILFLYAQNAQKMDLSEIVEPLLLAVGIIFALTVLLGMALRNFHKGALAITIMTILFFSYGHIINLLPDFRFNIGQSVIGPNGLLCPIWCLLAFAGLFFVYKSQGNLRVATKIMLQLGILLVAIQIIHGGYLLYAMPNLAPEVPEKIDTGSGMPEKRPDIYFIIMDGYARSDILEEIYGVDNSEFLNFLKEQGFQIADRSYSNYPQTIMSVSATLNLDYVQNLGKFNSESRDRLQLARRLWDNRVFKFLKRFGYTTVAFERTGSSYTESMKADVIIPIIGVWSEFESILLATTPLPLFLKKDNSRDAKQRRLVISKLEKLPDITEAPSPKFVFAHVFSPHKPFVFGPSGEALDSYQYRRVDENGDMYQKYVSGYADQVTYITRRLREAVADIIGQYEDNPPVIIIQGDHGPRSGMDWFDVNRANLKEIFAILNAIYLPGKDKPVIYDSISPVNTFRLIFNEYFDAGLDMLPDKHYYCGDDRPFDFIRITDKQLVSTRGRYDYLSQKNFDSLTTLDRMIMLEQGMIDRSLDECYTDEGPIMSFGNGQVILADCRLIRIKREYHLFEAAIVFRSRRDFRFNMELTFYTEERKLDSGAVKPAGILSYDFTPDSGHALTDPNVPLIVHKIVPLYFTPDKYKIDINVIDQDSLIGKLECDSEDSFIEHEGD